MNANEPSLPMPSSGYRGFTKRETMSLAILLTLLATRKDNGEVVEPIKSYPMVAVELADSLLRQLDR